MTDTMRTDLRRGDVILVLFPNSDLRTAKRRQALVIQANNLETGLQQIIVAMISSRLFRANHPSRVLIEIEKVGEASGLLTDSIVMTDNLATTILQAIDRKIGSLPMDKVNSALRHTLSL